MKKTNPWGNMTYECSNCGKQHNEAISCPLLLKPKKTPPKPVKKIEDKNELLRLLKSKVRLAQYRAMVLVLSQRLAKESAITETCLLNDIIFINELLNNL